MKNGMVKKISIYFIGTLSSNVINVLLVPIYAYYVSATSLGEYDYILSLSNMIVPIVFMVIWEAVLRYGLMKADSNSYFTNALLLVVVNCIIFAIVLSILTYINLIENNGILLFIFVVSQGFTFIWQYADRALQESKNYVLAGIIGSLVVVSTDIFFIVTESLDKMALSVSHVLSQVVIILIIESKIHLLSKFKMEYIEISKVKQMLSFSLPLVLNNVCLWFYSGGNKIIVQNYLGSYENGLFSFASKFSILINFFSTIISMAVIEEAYSYANINEYRDKMSKIIKTISNAYFSLVALAIPAIYLLYSLAFRNTEYYDSSNYVALLLMAALFTALSNNYGSSFQVTGNTRYIFITTVVGVVVSLVTSLVLGKNIGIWGILVGGVAGPLTMMVTRALYAKKTTGLLVSWKKNLIMIAINIIEALVLFIVEGVKVQFIITLIALTVVLLMNIKDVLLLLERIRKR